MHLIAAVGLALAACNTKPKEQPPSVDNDKASHSPGAPTPQAPQAPPTPAAASVPVPAEPVPLAAKADEVPGIEAKLVADKAYVAVWTTGHEEARLAMFTAISDLLASGSLHTAVEPVLKDAGLMDALGMMNGVLARSGKLPTDFTTRADAYLAANKTAPRLGLWNPFEKGKPVVDATALAMWMHPNEVPYVRERMLALVHGPFPYSGKEPERRRWLMNAAEVAQRVAALGAFTEADCTMLGHEWHVTTTSGVTSASCDPRSAPRPALPPLDKGVVLTVELSFGADRKATVSGDTNLPDGTQITVTVKEPGDVGTEWNSQPTVSAGRYTAGDISPAGGYPDGKYLADVVVPAPFTQPDAVKVVIGEKGEKLTGKLVEKNAIGDYIVRAHGSAVLGGADGVARGIARHAAVLQELLDIAQQLAPYTNGALDLGGHDACVARLRRELAIVEPLRTRLEGFGIITPGAGLLRVAGLSIVQCMDCAPGRVDRCRKARKDLDEAVQKIRAAKTS